MARQTEVVDVTGARSVSFVHCEDLIGLYSHLRHCCPLTATAAGIHGSCVLCPSTPSAAAVQRSDGGRESQINPCWGTSSLTSPSSLMVKNPGLNHDLSD